MQELLGLTRQQTCTMKPPILPRSKPSPLPLPCVCVGFQTTHPATMGLNFILMVNKQGQTRLSNYYNWLTIDERSTLEAEIIRKCLSRTEAQCSFMEFRGMKVVYRRYASLFFIVGVEAEEEVRFGRWWWCFWAVGSGGGVGGDAYLPSSLSLSPFSLLLERRRRKRERERRWCAHFFLSTLFLSLFPCTLAC